MNHETALSKAREIADRVLAPAARQNDKEGRFSTEAVDVLGRAGFLHEIDHRDRRVRFGKCRGDSKGDEADHERIDMPRTTKFEDW
jgi:hypothetical protein